MSSTIGAAMDLAQRPPFDAIDFKALAKADPEFKQLWQRTLGKLDFQDPETTKVLSKAILRTQFGLELDVPGDRLCPPIPNRWNYVAWIQGLIDSTSADYANKYDPDRQVIGLDIGTGASAIYTMLCLKSRPNWTMCATDIDKKSFTSAARNLAHNKLMSRSKLLETTALSPLIHLAALGVDHLDFTICNPPFFDNPAEMRSSLKGEGKSWEPNAICTGSENEMVCPGGDLGFVTTMVNESLVLREKVQWYSSMLGKLDSAKAIIHLLKKHGITNWAVGVIDVGSGTKRWIVAWSFGDLRPGSVSGNNYTLALVLNE
jgi:23S rRNA (adenine1618-N6)-methyltransferase